MMTENLSPLGMPEPHEHSGAPTKALSDGGMRGPATAPAPIVGIPIPVREGAQGPQFLGDAVSAWALERMGARLLLVPLWPLPPHQQVYQSLWPLLQSLDGVLLPAGVAAADEAFHQQAPPQAPGPEGWLIALAQLATSLGMPLLAIADGAQLWNTALGGTSRQAASDAPKSASPQSWERAALRVGAHSTLATLLASAMPAQEHESEPPLWELAGLSDHQIERLAPGLRACAHSQEGLIVAFERGDGAFGLGMSGRLEWGLEQPCTQAILAGFLHACRAFDAQRSRQPSWEQARESICATLSQRVAQGQSLIRGVQASASLQLRPVGLASRDQEAQATPQEATGQQRMRRRAELPTKEERNRMRRQRWNRHQMRQG